MDPYEFWVNMGTTAIMASIKSESAKVRLRRIMLKLFTSIRNAYAGDPDFA